MSAVRKRRAATASKRKRRTRRRGTGAAASTEARRVITGPDEPSRADRDPESVEDPLEDWPEEPEGDADRWLIERRGEDVERDD